MLPPISATNGTGENVSNLCIFLRKHFSYPVQDEIHHNGERRAWAISKRTVYAENIAYVKQANQRAGVEKRLLISNDDI